jgi:aldehyde:ferredoxin oxidoreductase
MTKGYNGKILFMDLSTKEMKAEQPDELFFRQYIGQGIMAAYFLLTRTRKNIDPLSGDNLLMFMSSVVSGQEAPGLARFTVCAKSPVTGGIGEARSEGPFAQALKKSGYDGIVLNGICREPSILVIDDGHISLESAGDIWGKKVDEATTLLEERYPGCHAAVIGPAGENLVRFANIISDRCHEASRAGMGAVMGSKKLKAVVLRGGRLPEAADPKQLEAFYPWFEDKMHKNVLSMWQYDEPGFGVWIHTHGIDASVGVNNYQSATCNYLDNYKPEHFKPFYRGVAECPGCPNNCIKCYSSEESKGRSGGLHQEIGGAMGPNIGNPSAKVIVDANVLCNELGMDPDSLGYVISFAQECVQRGILEVQELDLSFTEKADSLKLAEMIACRKGIGDLLAEGSARAARRIGGEAPRYALTVKGHEMTPIEPRSQTNLALGFATASIGPRYEICEHDWDFDTRVGWAHTLNYCRTLGIRERVRMDYLGKKKVHNFKMLSELWSAADGLGICLFATAPTRVYSLEDMAGLVRCVTGWETSSYELMRIGELRLHLYRVYNNREGIGPEQDVLPERFFEEEIDFGMHKGIKLEKEKFMECIRLYYEMMGWNSKGEPTQATLYDFGLGWLCE